MPKPHGRGRILKTRTVKVGPRKYIHVDVMSKKGPRGGRTVAGPVHTMKKKYR